MPNARVPQPWLARGLGPSQAQTHCHRQRGLPSLITNHQQARHATSRFDQGAPVHIPCRSNPLPCFLAPTVQNLPPTVHDFDHFAGYNDARGLFCQDSYRCCHDLGASPFVLEALRSTLEPPPTELAPTPCPLTSQKPPRRQPIIRRVLSFQSEHLHLVVRLPFSKPIMTVEIEPNELTFRRTWPIRMVMTSPVHWRVFDLLTCRILQVPSPLRSLRFLRSEILAVRPWHSRYAREIGTNSVAILRVMDAMY